MKPFLLVLSLTLSMGSIAEAATDAETIQADELPAYERVDYISALGGLHSFKPIDADTLIVWTNRSTPYLVKLQFPSSDLRWSHAIAIDAPTSRIHERFDSVRIAGLSYPIREIYKLSREQARQIRR